MRRTAALGTLLALFALSGCKEDGLPTGTAGRVIVQAFVDVDGSGGFTAGDVALTGSVSLKPVGGTATQMTLDANGQAIFTDVMPGSYQAAYVGTAPAGAVLATASLATVVVPFKGGDVPAQFRYVDNPGTIDGVMFRDDNGNGVFDAGADTPAPGLIVNLFKGTSEATAVLIATTTTDGTGHFHFGAVRPGTYTLESLGPPTITFVGGETIQVTVLAAASTQALVKFTGSLAITIAQARTHLAGDTVSVVGVVYAGTNLYTLPTAANLNMYIRDSTGGSQVFGIPTGTTFLPGDSVSVRGVVAFFSGEYEISKFASGAPTVNRLGTGTTVLARSVTTTDFAAKRFDGQLLRVNGLQVVSVGTPNASGAYNVTTTALDGTTITVRIAASPVGILNTSWVVGTRYDVAGAALNFVSGATTTPELMPRSPADVALSNVNVITILNAKTNHVGDTVTVEGVVTAGRGTFNAASAYIQDGTSGTQIFNVPASLSLVVGDAVRVHGKMTTFSNENEITNNITPTDSIKITKLGPGGPVGPKVLTGVQFLSRTFEGQLVTLPSVTITTIGTVGGTGTYTVNGTALDGSPIVIFMGAPTGAVPPPAGLYTVGSKYDLTGLAVPFGTPAAAELKPRGAFDVVPH